MAPFKKGDVVVCTDASGQPENFPQVSIGNAYIVMNCFYSPRCHYEHVTEPNPMHNRSLWGVRLEGIPTVGFAATRFDKIEDVIQHDEARETEKILS